MKLKPLLDGKVLEFGRFGQSHQRVHLMTDAPQPEERTSIHWRRPFGEQRKLTQFVRQRAEIMGGDDTGLLTVFAPRAHDVS